MKTEQREKLYDRLEHHIQETYKIGQELGYEDILEKGKYKEVMIARILGHRVFPKSTGEEEGADAIDEKTGKLWEYKTSNVTRKFFHKLCAVVFDAAGQFASSMTYNNGYSRAKVNSYKDIGHIHSLVDKGIPVVITEMNTDYITSDDGLMKRVLKTEGGHKYKSTNGNSVAVHYENGGVRENEGKVIYKNDIRK